MAQIVTTVKLPIDHGQFNNYINDHGHYKKERAMTAARAKLKRQIFILNGHPAETSISRTLAEAYREAATAAGHSVRTTYIHDLAFDSDYGFGGYVNQKPLEDCLEQVLTDVEWSDHFVLTTPMWWGGLPAKTKGLFDRAFLPGRTFDTRNPHWTGLPAPMLTGRTGRVIMTSDSPDWFFRLAYKRAMAVSVKKQIFEFVGIKPTRITHFSPASDPKPGQIEKWIKKAMKLGAQAQ
jgi:NAD(P)H dehydrogenase (quinone)